MFVIIVRIFGFIRYFCWFYFVFVFLKDFYSIVRKRSFSCFFYLEGIFFYVVFLLVYSLDEVCDNLSGLILR